MFISLSVFQRGNVAPKSDKCPHKSVDPTWSQLNSVGPKLDAQKKQW